MPNVLDFYSKVLNRELEQLDETVSPIFDELGVPLQDPSGIFAQLEPLTKVQGILDSPIQPKIEDEFPDVKSLSSISKLRKQGWDEDTIKKALTFEIAQSASTKTPIVSEEKTVDNIGSPLRSGLKQLVDYPAAGGLRMAGAIQELGESLNETLERDFGKDYIKAYEDPMFNALFGNSLDRALESARGNPEEFNFYEAAKSVEAATEGFFKPTPPTGQYSEPVESIFELVNPIRFYQLAAEGAPLLLGLMALTAVSPVASTGLMFAGEGGEIIRRANEYEELTGRKVDPVLKLGLGIAGGGVNAALERIGINRFLNTMQTKELSKRIARVIGDIFVESTTEGLQADVTVLTQSIYDEFVADNLPEELADAFIKESIAAIPVSVIGAGVSQGMGQAKSREKQVKKLVDKINKDDIPFTIEYDDENTGEVIESESWYKERNYDPEVEGFEQVGEENGEKQYKAISLGLNTIDEKTGAVQILLNSKVGRDVVAEELVEGFFKQAERTNPELAGAIRAYAGGLRQSLIEAGKNPGVSDIELFSKAFVFHHLGYANKNPEHASMYSMPREMYNSFVELMGDFSDGTNIAEFLKGDYEIESAVFQEEESEAIAGQAIAEDIQERAPPSKETHQLVPAHHYSKEYGIINLSPEKMDLKSTNKDAQRIKSEAAPKRVYFYLGEESEPSIKTGANVLYTSIVETDDYYDLIKDEQGLWDKHDDLTAIETDIKSQGFKGHIGYLGGNKDMPVLASYYDVPAEKFDILRHNLKKLAENTGLPENIDDTSNILGGVEVAIETLFKDNPNPTGKEIVKAVQGVRKWSRKNTLIDYKTLLQSLNKQLKKNPEFGSWYDSVADVAKDVVGIENIVEFSGLFGITSAQASPEVNFANTLFIMRIARQYSPITQTKKFKEALKNEQLISDETQVYKFLTDKDITKISKWYNHVEFAQENRFKTPLYAQTIKERAFNEYFPFTVHDTWMSKLFGLNGQPNDVEYRIMNHLLSRLARETNLRPDVVQALLWDSVRGKGRTPGTAESIQSMVKGEIDAYEQKPLLGNRFPTNPDKARILAFTKDFAVTPEVTTAVKEHAVKQAPKIALEITRGIPEGSSPEKTKSIISSLEGVIFSKTRTGLKLKLAEHLGVPNTVEMSEGRYNGKVSPNYIISFPGLSINDAESISKVMSKALHQEAQFVFKIQKGEVNAFLVRKTDGSKIERSESQSFVRDTGLDYTLMNDGQALFVYPVGNFDEVSEILNNLPEGSKLELLGVSTDAKYKEEKEYDSIPRYKRLTGGRLGTESWANNNLFDPLNTIIQRNPEFFGGTKERPPEQKTFRLEPELTPEFKKWFGDSKVVDEDGKPLVVYHGAKSSFDEFFLGKKQKEHFGDAYWKYGQYFTPDPNVAGHFALTKGFKVISNKTGKDISTPQTYPVYLNIKKPLIIDSEEEGHILTGRDRERAIRRVTKFPGLYDGVILKGHSEPAKKVSKEGEISETKDTSGVIYIAFKPNQIKSATGNIGTFSKEDSRITHSLVKSTDKKEPVSSLYEKGKDDWFGNRDWATQVASVRADEFQKRIKKTDKNWKDIDRAIHIYLDLKQNPQHLDEYYESLTNEQKSIVDLSQNLSKEQKKIASDISKVYDKIGKQSKDKQIIHNLIDNYVSRVWDLGEKPSSEEFRKFGTSTRHAKQRVFETILEGMSNGYTLKIEGATNNLMLLESEIANVIEHKKLLKTGMKIKNKNGKKLFSFNQEDGYKKIEHPNFTWWGYSGTIELEPLKQNLKTISREKFNHKGEYSKPIETLIQVIRESLMARGMAHGEADAAITRVMRARKKDAAIEKTVNQLEEQSEVVGAKIVPKLGKNFIVTEDGTILQKKPIYAPEDIADELNRILGSSKLKGIKAIDRATKYNAIVKAWILQSSFFHHLAFTRSYLFGGALEKLSDANPVSAYKKGLKSIRELDPEIELLVRSGLTLGRNQDWDETIKNQKTKIGEILDKTRATKAVKNRVLQFQEAQAKALFQRYGAGLKARAALLEYHRLLKEEPQLNPDERAKMVANLINDDFGGLHHGRLKTFGKQGRNPTVQHIARLFLLAPDWTESNVRSMIKAVNAGSKAETRLYRQFWKRIALRGGGLTLATTLILSLWDDEDDDGKEIGYKKAVQRRFKKAWDKGHLRWMDTDITPIYKGLGGEKDKRAYFSIMGHFRDPVKFVVHPVVSLKHKGSVIFRVFFEALTGSDWRNRRYTNWDEFIGIDDKGLYKTSRAGKYKKGDRKGGRLAGQLTKFSLSGGPLEYGQIPSFTLAQMRSMQPIQIQNLMAYASGEMDGMMALGKSIGFHMTVTRDPDKLPKKVKPVFKKTPGWAK